MIEDHFQQSLVGRAGLSQALTEDFLHRAMESLRILFQSGGGRTRAVAVMRHRPSTRLLCSVNSGRQLWCSKESILHKFQETLAWHWRAIDPFDSVVWFAAGCFCSMDWVDRVWCQAARLPDYTLYAEMMLNAPDRVSRTLARFG